jgi:hypothetical protein
MHDRIQDQEENTQKEAFMIGTTPCPLLNPYPSLTPPPRCAERFSLKGQVGHADISLCPLVLVTCSLCYPSDHPFGVSFAAVSLSSNSPNGGNGSNRSSLARWRSVAGGTKA